MIRRGFAVELRWFVLSMAAAAIVGVAVGYFLAVMCLALLLYVCWLFYNITRLEAWIIAARRKTNPRNELYGIFGEIAEDVVLLRKRYQKEKLRLQAVVSRVQDMTSALTDGVVLLDSLGNIEWWNEAAKQMFDLRDVDHGHKLTNIIRHPRFVKYFENGKYGDPLELEGIRHPDQHLQFQIHPFGQGERLVVLRDVTRVYKLEQMRKDFVANVSHELRTPLTVVRGYIETLSDAPSIPPAWARALTAMQGQCQRMTALINDLITLTKLETDEREIRQEAVDIGPLIQTIMSDAQALNGESTHTLIHKGDDNLVLRGNEKELRSAVSNLVFNAMKYSPDGCKIEVQYTANEHDVVISVSDTGVGIDPKHLPRLTERFYRVDGGRATTMGGTGLGLAIVKHVLLRHDAQLRISSKVGKGSTFSCHFPKARLIKRAK
ncbi:phosphate regulon sensor histidine kinase PhoR [Saccharophagus degradans]|uniref:Phosphate regulon sensor protein PhoR n=1 Tax=Saccharophagus degradans (strain 2-40 / ATCC 43961 / DSM 17024) TaxID=203122 RepID=Q21DY5_SACD2|nr:phosphate regulon sensor histidine kinase PhoR [Saccharophagus degradans]ABD83094.1 ATP-binding region, ATPase-like protein [Saccharophagus degradans 2-40]MBU2987084.1 phosphate regulon sensor histidine kinase PhoR [Saccharophagus degradans]